MRTITPTILLALSLALPTTLAVWGGHGSWEPDHAADVTDLFMWAEADQSLGGSRVYFNALAISWTHTLRTRAGSAQATGRPTAEKSTSLRSCGVASSSKTSRAR